MIHTNLKIIDRNNFSFLATKCTQISIQHISVEFKIHGKCIATYDFRMKIDIRFEEKCLHISNQSIEVKKKRNRESKQNGNIPRYITLDDG